MTDIVKGIRIDAADLIFTEIETFDSANVFECIRLDGLQRAARDFQVFQFEAEFEEVVGGQGGRG